MGERREGRGGEGEVTEEFFLFVVHEGVIVTVVRPGGGEPYLF